MFFEIISAVTIFSVNIFPYEMVFKLINDFLSEVILAPMAILFDVMIEYYTISARGQSRIHQFDEKVLSGIFFEYA